jgi:hypothetical protein
MRMFPPPLAGEAADCTDKALPVADGHSHLAKVIFSQILDDVEPNSVRSEHGVKMLKIESAKKFG